MIDARKWAPLARWAGALKFDVTALALSAASPASVVAAGLDSEVRAFCWVSACAHALLHARVGRARVRARAHCWVCACWVCMCACALRARAYLWVCACVHRRMQ